MPKQKPIIGITMGDGAGVGSEIIMKVLSDEQIYEICAPFVIGDAKMLELAREIVKSNASVREVFTL